MKFQKKYEEYRQRQEAKNFFNQNNDYYLKPLDYIKLSVTGIATGTVVSLVFDIIDMQLNMSFMVFYLFTGYAVAYAVLKVARYGSVKTGVICVVSYLLGLWLASAAVLVYLYQSFGASISIIHCLQMAFKGMFQADLFTYLFIFAGAFIAYTIGKD